MNLANILTRKGTMKRAFVALESDMDDILKEEFLLPAEMEAPAEPMESEEQDDTEWVPELEADLAAGAQDETTDEERLSERMTAHAQARFTDIAAFDEARATVQQQLDVIGAALAKIQSSHHLGRDFIDDCYADVRRANELDHGVAALSSENRKLTDRLEKLEKLRGRYDQLIEVMKRREAKLMTEADQMREEMAAAKLEAVEARSAASRAEMAQNDMHTTLAARSSEAERFMRENELLREKNVSLALDLDKALQRQAETRRKFEDISSLHTGETARIAKMAAKLASEEKEASRLQQLADSLEQKLIEANDAVAGFNREMDEREELYQSELHALRSEIQSLLSRVQAGVSDQNETAAEITALNARLSEAESQKTFAERKLADMTGEMQVERARQTSLHERQVKEMLAKIEGLNRTVAGLRQQRGTLAGKAELPEVSAVRPRSRPASTRAKRARASA
ncbi:MAG: hypothetical protein J0J14_06925 [Hyphomicrobium sp.]|nr:hypothetical protein [Mesorhizobium sp.]MBN9243599.1 hypothetical protein [Mesorhizobium sp.]MBN9260588.1 hypothetical protein [Hyphomicrobium sp.]